MIVIPAIDIKGGKCVRLTQGKYNKETIYYDDPLAVAKMWQEKGAQYLHIVDLDGALTGKDINYQKISMISKELSIPIEVGGGIRDQLKIEKYLNAGVSRVILGTSAVNNIGFVRDMCRLYPQQVAVSIDAKDNYVAIKGWVETSTVHAFEFAKELQSVGVNTIIYTDIAKDGMLSGPNLQALTDLQKEVDMNIIASGGISNKQDIKALAELHLYGAITGKALYEGTLTLEQLNLKGGTEDAYQKNNPLS
ncbi:MAG: 1-(5-phosphoribosyl)-5-[(5-phosphoribosylamino)methylideneamino]imidazole-4-carboxamide isomerase [Eubacteriales bacterium]